MNPEKLQYDKIYHIYSHGVGLRNVFKVAENYEFFLHIYEKYIEPVGNTYAWVLMPNHVHFVVKIKKEEEVAAVLNSNSDRVLNSNSDRVLNSVRDKNDKPLKIGTPSQQFSKLFNSYAQSYNKWVGTRGPLFERPFKRKQVENIQYLKRLIIYIHQNPVHHGFCEHPLEYGWSSYLTCTSDKSTKLKRKEVIEWFGGKKAFKEEHVKRIDMEKMDWEMGII